MLFDAKRVLFVGVHTDDEMIAAGTLHRLAKAGADVTVFTFSTAGIEGDPLDNRSPFLNEIVLAEWERSVNIIGGQGVPPVGGFFRPSYKLLDMQQEVRQEIANACKELQPDAAFILSTTDAHPEHAAAAAACEAVMRGRVKTILRCHLPWSPDSGRGSLYVSLSEADVEAKRAVIRAYASQAWRYDYENLLMSQAVADGKSVKVEAAERFEVVRCVA